MKRLLLMLLALPAMVMGQSTEAQTRDSLSLLKTIYYERDQYISTEQDREGLEELVFQMRDDSTLCIRVVGFSDKWGGDEINDRLSYVRAQYIGDWIRSCRVPREQIVYVGEGIDSEAKSDDEARRVEVSQVIQVTVEPEPVPVPEEDARAAEPIEPIDTEMQVEPEETTPEPVVTPEPVAEEAVEAEEPAVDPASGFQWRNFDLRTNLLYFAGGMFNVGTQYRQEGSSFGYVLNVGYSPFGGADWAHSIGGWFVSPEVRYYLPSNDNWFVGAQLLAGGFNIKLSDVGYQGSVVGGGVMGGYKIELTERFDMDFTLGLGYGSYNYDTYDHVRDINVYRSEGLHKGSLLPQAGVNLIWKIK